MSVRPPVVLVDLDNTLIDRSAVFHAWAREFLTVNGIAESELPWLLETDEDGFLAREAFFAIVGPRFGLGIDVGALVAAYRERYLDFVGESSVGTFAALAELRRSGRRVGILSNGSPNQERVVDRAGLRERVDAVCVSATVGIAKPDPAVFAVAAEMCGAELEGGWMVGDSPRHDIAGAAAAGLRSVWIARGRGWQEAAFAPTAIAQTFAQAATIILEAG